MTTNFPRRKIFITHSWNDNDFATKLRDDLIARGYQVWYDEKNLKADKPIAAEINSGLSECDIYLPILSNDMLNSSWCKTEFSTAITLSKYRNRGRPGIVPVLAKDCRDKLANVFPTFIDSLYVTFYEQKYEVAFEDLMRKIDEVEIGILLDKYRIEAKAGYGTFGDVFHVTRLTDKQPFAIKRLRRSTGADDAKFNESREEFKIEAELGKKLTHPNITKVYGYEEVGDDLYLIMEDAIESLRDRLGPLDKIVPLAIAQTVRIALDICDGLTELHTKLNVVHRDIKPSNILLGRDGRWKIADLGIAQRKESGTRTTQGRNAPKHPGTDYYKSPEQESDTRPLHATSDIFSLGCVLFECLSGKIWYITIPRGNHVRKWRSDVPMSFDRVVARMLCPEPGIDESDVGNPQKRYVTAADVRADLMKVKQIPRAISVTLKVLAIVFLIFLGAMFLSQGSSSLGIFTAATSTPTPSSTPTLTSTPTSTFTPTSTPTQTPTITFTPSITPEPTITPSRTATRIPPTPTSVYKAPILQSPQNGDSQARETQFTWTWDGTLKADESFDVFVWPQNAQQASIANTKDRFLKVNLCNWNYGTSGQFLWTVRVKRDGGGFLSDAPPSFVLNVKDACGGGGPAPTSPPGKKGTASALLLEPPSGSQVVGTGGILGFGMFLGLILLSEQLFWRPRKPKK